MPSPWPSDVPGNYVASLSERRDRHVYVQGLDVAPRLPDDDRQRRQRRRTVAAQRAASSSDHEHVHVWQARWFGPLYPLLYGAWTVLGAVAGVDRLGGRAAATSGSGEVVDTMVVLLATRSSGGRTAAKAAGRHRGDRRPDAGDDPSECHVPDSQRRHSVSSKHSRSGEGGALGGEVGADEVEHASGGPVEQRVDRVAMLGRRPLPEQATPTREGRRSPPPTCCTSGKAARSGAIHASTSSPASASASTVGSRSRHSSACHA